MKLGFGQPGQIVSNTTTSSSNLNIFQKNVIALKCSYAELVSSLTDEISKHNCDVDQMKLAIKILDAYFKRFYCYNYLTYAYRFDFTANDTIGLNGFLNVIVKDARVIANYTYTDASLTDIINTCSNDFLNDTYTFGTVVSGNSLYVYSSDTELYFNDIINKITQSGDVTVTVTSLEYDDDFEIDNNINSIPFDYICQMFSHAKKLIADNGIDDCGCN